MGTWLCVSVSFPLCIMLLMSASWWERILFNDFLSFFLFDCPVGQDYKPCKVATYVRGTLSPSTLHVNWPFVIGYSGVLFAPWKYYVILRARQCQLILWIALDWVHNIVLRSVLFLIILCLYFLLLKLQMCKVPQFIYKACLTCICSEAFCHRSSAAKNKYCD